MILDARRHWYCPNCKQTSTTVETQPHTRFHACARGRGLAAPMLLQGVKAKISAREREDYIGTEQVKTDAEGRPVMAVVTEREDGSNDVSVFAPTAHARVVE